MRSTAPHIPQSKASIEAAPKEAASKEAASKEEVSKEAASKEALLLRARRPGSERRFKGSGRGGREKYCDLSPADMADACSVTYSTTSPNDVENKSGMLSCSSVSRVVV